MRLAKPRRRAGAVSATTAEAGDSSEGDQHVQENLVSMLRIQIGKQTVNDIADSESEKLRQSVDEVRPSKEQMTICYGAECSLPCVSNPIAISLCAGQSGGGQISGADAGSRQPVFQQRNGAPTPS